MLVQKKCREFSWNWVYIVDGLFNKYKKLKIVILTLPHVTLRMAILKYFLAYLPLSLRNDLSNNVSETSRTLARTY